MRISSDLIKNDVPAVGQLRDSDCVSFALANNADIKILFLGNSITRHGKAESLGWFGDWGMAASCKENDYVHRLVARMEQDGKRVSYCVANLSEWERTRDMALLKSRYAQANAFAANIVIVRLGENAQLAEHLDAFIPCYRDMVAHFAHARAKVVLTDLFWGYEPFDTFVKNYATEKGYGFAQLHDLGNRNDMKAIGKFAHAGVAAHPSDNGMAVIAQRLYTACLAV